MKHTLFVVAIFVVLSGFVKVSFAYEITPKCEKMLTGEMIWQVRDTQPQYSQASDQELIDYFFKVVEVYENVNSLRDPINFDKETCIPWWSGDTSKLSAFDNILWVAFDIPIRDY